MKVESGITIAKASNMLILIDAEGQQVTATEAFDIFLQVDENQTKQCASDMKQVLMERMRTTLPYFALEFNNMTFICNINVHLDYTITTEDFFLITDSDSIDNHKSVNKIRIQFGDCSKGRIVDSKGSCEEC